MFGADLDCGEKAEERCICCGCLNCGAAVCFLALHEANNRGHFHAGFARSFNGVDSGRAGGANVVDDYNGSTLTTEAFNAAAGAMGLLGFADQEAVNQRRTRMGLGTPGACSGDIAHNGVGAHGEPADGIR